MVKTVSCIPLKLIVQSQYQFLICSILNCINNTPCIGGTIGVNFDAKSRSGARLDYYNIEIHDHPVSGQVSDEYKIINEQFTENFKGLVNSHVHKHIVVPDIANLGSYHVVIIVVDEDGNYSDTEALDVHIEIIE